MQAGQVAVETAGQPSMTSAVSQNVHGSAMASHLSTEFTSEDIDDFFRIKPMPKPRADQIINRSSTRVAQGSGLIHSDAKLNRTEKLPEEFIPPYKR